MAAVEHQTIFLIPAGQRHDRCIVRFGINLHSLTAATGSLATALFRLSLVRPSLRSLPATWWEGGSWRWTESTRRG
ncbi:MAG: hypothetical protein KGL48_02450 [Sphingomonadales bacterium]|nr:hypothetical protein [Sphingomonadales bacterium]MDE2569693.1 hypothetical protein [Sphingomonadales bacterium]